MFGASSAAALGHLDEQQLDEVERQEALQQARLDALGAAAASAGEQGGDDPLHGAVGGDVAGDRHGGEDRTAAAQLALERQHPPACERRPRRRSPGPRPAGRPGPNR